MRIGLITGEYPPMQGGVGDCTRELARALVALDHSVFVLTSREGQGELGTPIRNVIRKWDFGSLKAAKNWALDNQLDVVDIQFETAAYGMSPYVHFLPLWLKPLPVVTTFHDLLVPYLFPKAGRLRRGALLMLARSSDGVIVTNIDDEAQMKAERAIKRLARIPIGSNIPTRPPDGFERETWRAQFRIEPDMFLIGYFGFINSSKGVDTLLDALAEVVKSGINIRLLMIGGKTGTSDPENAIYAAQIEQQIERLGLDERVEWTGYVTPEQVSAHLMACDAVALPFKDGASLRRGSLLAALAHGCAIVATTPAVSIPELRDGDTVSLVAPGSVEELASALRRLAQNQELRVRLSAGAAEVGRQFGWGEIAMRTAEFFGAVQEESG